MADVVVTLVVLLTLGAYNNLLQLLKKDAVEVSVKVRANSTDTGGVNLFVGIGVDSSTVNSAQVHSGTAISASPGHGAAFYRGFPGLGYHELRWLEGSTASGTTSWFSAGGGAYNSGIVGMVMA